MSIIGDNIKVLRKKAWNEILKWLEKKGLSYSETEVFVRKQIEECS